VFRDGRKSIRRSRLETADMIDSDRLVAGASVEPEPKGQKPSVGWENVEEMSEEPKKLPLSISLSFRGLSFISAFYSSCILLFFSIDLDNFGSATTLSAERGGGSGEGTESQKRAKEGDQY